jgi:hypothetical protein
MMTAFVDAETYPKSRDLEPIGRKEMRFGDRHLSTVS